MGRVLAMLLLGMTGVAAHAADPCAGKVAATILAYDRDMRQGVGLLLNYCGHPVRAELRVTAHNRNGFPVSWVGTTVQTATAAPLSVIQVELPFVQSVVALSSYTAEVAGTTALDMTPEQNAGNGARLHSVQR